MATWESDDGGTWTRYPDSISRALETAFQAGKAEHTFTAPNGTSYTVAFAKSIQYMTDMPDRVRAVRATRAAVGANATDDGAGSGSGAGAGGGEGKQESEKKVEAVSVGLWFDNITGFDEPTWVRRGSRRGSRNQL